MEFVNKKLRKLEPEEVIENGDFSSLDNGDTLLPIFNPKTIGDYPKFFSKDRTFWRLVNG